MSVVQTEIKENIAILWVDYPPVNALGQKVRAGLIEEVQNSANNEKVKAIIIACRGRTFFAGADIKEFGKPPLEPFLPEVINFIESQSKPIIAAIHGTALGGGFEVALGCHYRIALGSAKMGLPEVALGLLPGAGGTQRLPRIAGVKKALKMITSAKPISANEALKSGIIGRLVEENLIDEAINYAQDLINEGAGPKRISEMKVDKTTLPKGGIEGFRQSIARKTRGFQAPENCLKAVEGSLALSFEKGLKNERKLFMECLKSPQSAAQRHLFFAERQSSKLPDIPKDTPIRDIKKVGIIGAGTMGGGIAMAFVNAGYPVTLLDVSQEGLDRGIANIAKNYEASAKRGLFSKAQVEEKLGLITPTTEYQDLSDIDLVIEAVFEKMEIKKAVFAELEKVTKPNCILATNTSYLDINEIANSTARPDDVVGLHFFSPANIMKLLEIVRADKTAPDVLATVLGLAKKIKKIGVVSGVCFGFIGNRIMQGYIREAGLCMMEGASPSQIDKAMFDFGMPMGPMAMGDMAGLDISYLIRKARSEDDYEARAFKVHDRLVEMNRKGQKTGAGFYKYEEGNRTPQPDPEVDKMIEEEAEKAGFERRNITDEEIVERCLLAMINEGANILHEGIAVRSGDIDVVYANGYGFPRYRGGPMHYAEHLGLDKVLERIQVYNKSHGPRWWTPSPLIEKLAGEKKGFQIDN